MPAPLLHGFWDLKAGPHTYIAISYPLSRLLSPLLNFLTSKSIACVHVFARVRVCELRVPFVPLRPKSSCVRWPYVTVITSE